MSPRMDHSTTLQLTPIGRSGPYTLFSGVLEKNLNAFQIIGSSVDVAGEGLQSELTFFKILVLMR